MANLTRRHFGGMAMAIGFLAFQRRASACSVTPPVITVAAAIRSRLQTTSHPLTGRVWSNSRAWTSAERTYVNPCGLYNELADLMLELAGAPYVLLGEIHDNDEHHATRATMLQVAQWQSSDSGSSPSRPRGVVFEQIRADQQEALVRFAAMSPSGTTDDLLAALDWEHSPWSKTADYKPLFDATVANKLAIYSGDPPRDVIRKAAKEGIAAAVSAEERTHLALDVPLGEAADAASLAEIEASHCGMIPKSTQPNMAQAQRYRDAHMADALIRAADAHGSAVLFAGNGHVRTDRGVPWYLHTRKPDAKVVSVMLIEVEDGQNDPEAYVPRAPNGTPATDYIVFTPRAKRDSDPCEGMKRKAQ